MRLVRGRVYEATINEQTGKKLYLVVSNNRRNKALGTALVVRLTTSPKPDVSSIVALPHGEAFSGRVLCDDIEDMYESEVERDVGGLGAHAMEAVGDGLKAALAL